jgi:hypothetical protein
MSVEPAAGERREVERVLKAVALGAVLGLVLAALARRRARG